MSLFRFFYFLTPYDAQASSACSALIYTIMFPFHVIGKLQICDILSECTLALGYSSRDLFIIIIVLLICCTQITVLVPNTLVKPRLFIFFILICTLNLHRTALFG